MDSVFRVEGALRSDKGLEFWVRGSEGLGLGFRVWGSGFKFREFRFRV